MFRTTCLEAATFQTVALEKLFLRKLILQKVPVDMPSARELFVISVCSFKMNLYEELFPMVSASQEDPSKTNWSVAVSPQAFLQCNMSLKAITIS